MKPAIADFAEADYSYVDVYRDDWEQLKQQIERLSLEQVGTDPPTYGYSRYGYTLYGTQSGLFQELKKKVEQIG